jgi:hypothetical protein
VPTRFPAKRQLSKLIQSEQQQLPVRPELKSDQNVPNFPRIHMYKILPKIIHSYLTIEIRRKVSKIALAKYFFNNLDLTIFSALA